MCMVEKYILTAYNNHRLELEQQHSGLGISFVHGEKGFNSQHTRWPQESALEVFLSTEPDVTHRPPGLGQKKK